MDQERARIQEDLRGVVDGEVRCDDLFLQMYSSDASIYQIKPRAVIRPRHCLLYTSPSPRDRTRSRMPSSA